MSIDIRHLGRLQLDRTLKPYQILLTAQTPDGGWLRAVRTTLGMTALALAKRLQVARGTVADLERSEASGTATLNSLRKAAAAMDCEMVYAIVPRTSLEAIMKKRAEVKARLLLQHVAQSMKLEAQGVGPTHDREQTQILTDALLSKPRALWK